MYNSNLLDWIQINILLIKYKYIYIPTLIKLVTHLKLFAEIALKTIVMWSGWPVKYKIADTVDK